MSDLTGPTDDLALALDAAAARHDPSRSFMSVDGKITTYGELGDRMLRLGACFRGIGLSAGARVGIVTRSSQDAASILLAGFRAGFAMINLNPELTGQERDLAIRSAKLAHIFADEDIVAPVDQHNGPSLTLIETAGARQSGQGLVGRLLAGRPPKSPDRLHAMLAGIAKSSVPPDLPGARAGDTALMLFTSGTTSQPKVVELSGANLMAQIATFHRLYEYGPGSRILNPLPLHFTDGLLHGPIMAFLSGATLVRPGRFDFARTGELLETVREEGITHFIVVPALLSLMARLGPDYDGVFGGSEFRFIRSSGDRLPETLWKTIQDRFRVRVVNTYGLSETVCEALYCGPRDEHFRFGTVGKPVDCEARVADEDGSQLPDGKPGELMIRGDNIMKGYLDQPELTELAMADGWFRTGDLATRDSDGFFRIVGRKKNIIVTGGVNVQPQDIVDAVLSHPAVSDAFALGLSDPDFNQIVGCAIVPTDPDAEEGQLVRDLTNHCRKLLAPQKIPRRIRVLAALPRNAAGKVLADRLAEDFDQTGRDRTGDPDLDVLGSVLAAAAGVFGCGVDDLDAGSTPFTTPGWDSLAHLNLIGAVEARLGLRLTAGDVMQVNSLGDLATIAEAARRQG